MGGKSPKYDVDVLMQVGYVVWSSVYSVCNIHRQMRSPVRTAQQSFDQSFNFERTGLDNLGINIIQDAT